MINIISKSYTRYGVSGPKKVVDNLVKGLRLINYPFVINKRLDACQRLWIHDDVAALRELKNLPQAIKVVVGPNLFVKPSQVPPEIDFSKAVYLHPSQWSADFWKTFGFATCPIAVWPAGIDTFEFSPSARPKEYVLIYFKQRAEFELQTVTTELKKRNIVYRLIRYPAYSEKEYKELLGGARYAIWLGRHESQGIALEEALAMDVPMVVCDVTKISDWTASQKEMAQFSLQEAAYPKATAAEYFDETCGVRITSLQDLPQAVTTLEQDRARFKPREYILSHLSLEKQARDFVAIYQKYFSLSFQAGLTEQVLHAGNWQNAAVGAKMSLWAKDGAKAIIKRFRRLTS